MIIIYGVKGAPNIESQDERHPYMRAFWIAFKRGMGLSEVQEKVKLLIKGQPQKIDYMPDLQTKPFLDSDIAFDDLFRYEIVEGKTYAILQKENENLRNLFKEIREVHDTETPEYFTNFLISQIARALQE